MELWSHLDLDSREQQAKLSIHSVSPQKCRSTVHGQYSHYSVSPCPPQRELWTVAPLSNAFLCNSTKEGEERQCRETWKEPNHYIQWIPFGRKLWWNIYVEQQEEAGESTLWSSPRFFNRDIKVENTIGETKLARPRARCLFLLYSTFLLLD